MEWWFSSLAVSDLVRLYHYTLLKQFMFKSINFMPILPSMPSCSLSYWSLSNQGKPTITQSLMFKIVDFCLLSRYYYCAGNNENKESINKLAPESLISLSTSIILKCTHIKCVSDGVFHPPVLILSHMQSFMYNSLSLIYLEWRLGNLPHFWTHPVALTSHLWTVVSELRFMQFAETKTQVSSSWRICSLFYFKEFF